MGTCDYMKRDTTKKYYTVHSWVGAITAILLFIIAYTGAVSVFGRPELKVWANTEIRHGATSDFAAIESLVNQHAQSIDPSYYEHVRVLLPGKRSYTSLVVVFEKETEDADGKHLHEALWFEHHPLTLELIEKKQGDIGEIFSARSKDMADFIIEFHADLHLGSPLGLALTGLLGLTLFLSIITGVVIHRKVAKELFTFRPWRSLRLLFTDTHKVLGVWGLLFHATIAFTGAFLGLATVLLIPAAAYVSFGGDQEKLIETFLPEVSPELSGTNAEMQLAKPLQALSNSENGIIVVDANIYGWGDAEALLHVGTLGGNGLGNMTHEYRAANGKFLGSYTTFDRHDGFTGPILDAMFPLHFGNFGGLFVKILWFFLGLSTAMLAVTGMMIWIERRAFGSEGSLSSTTYQRISRMTAGICVGLVAASVSLFYAQLLLRVPGKDMNFWLGVVFFAVWIVAIMWALVRANAYRITKELLFCSGLLAFGVAPLNAAVTGDSFITMLGQGHMMTAGVDLSVLISGALLIWLAVKLPSNRPSERFRTSDSTKLQRESVTVGELAS